MIGILRRLAVWLGLLCVLCAGLVYLAPATWWDLGLRRVSNDVLSLGGVRGTFWRGSGSLQAMLPHGSAVTLSAIQWQLRAGDLVRGRLRVSVLAAGSGQVILDMSAGRAGLTVYAAHLEMPASLLGSLSPTLRAAAPGGHLTLSSDGLRYVGGQFAGRAELVWRDATSSLTSVRPLGDYRLDLDGAGTGLNCRLSTLGDAALSFDGTAVWQPGRPLTFAGSARPAATQRRELSPLLRLFGQETAPGVYRLQLDPHVAVL
ncbi:MAG: type II secretion system protein N [Gallionellaceae bacterium]|nr:type II secretion system protein N [Gallionellaceae bacterium]